MTISTHHEFDVWNEVPLVPQLTGMSCWAAAAAMIIGWRDVLHVDPEQVASGAGRWSEYNVGLQPFDLADFARAWGLTSEAKLDWSVAELRELLERYGPVWVGEASPGLHSIVITGMHGDGTDRGTRVRINDPWPIGKGERYSLTAAQLMSNFRAATSLAGVHAQVLHAGGRHGGPSGHYEFTERSETHVSNGTPPSQDADMYARDERRRHHEEYPAGFGSAVAIAAGTVAAGELYLDTSSRSPDPLAGHGGTGDNLCIVWNAMPAETTSFDIVIHLHGYSSLDPTSQFLRGKVTLAGLDLSGRTRPTVGIIPRGRKITQAEIAADPKNSNPERYTFPAVTRGNCAGLHQLVTFALEHFRRTVLHQPDGANTLGRVIITAHSGGGSPLNQILAWRKKNALCNPEEVHAFDAFYGDTTNILAWVKERIAADRGLQAAQLAEQGGGLRVVYREGRGGTAEGSRFVARSLPGPGDPLHTAYRAELTSVGHNNIPGAFGPAFLRDVRSELTARAAAHSLDTSGLSWEEARAFNVDDDVRAWLAADASTRSASDAKVAAWIAATDRSAIELLSDAARRKHFLEEVDWSKQHFKGNGPNERESEALFEAMTQPVPERRVPFTVRYHTVPRDDTSVVPDSGGHRLIPEAKDAFVRMRSAAEAAGLKLVVGSSWRSEESQRAAAERRKNPAAVAPGISAHNYGVTVDLHLSVPGLRIWEISTASMANMVAMYRSPIYKWLALHAREFGFFPYRREPWHWEYNPPGFKERFEGTRVGGYGAPVGLLEAYRDSPPDYEPTQISVYDRSEAAAYRTFAMQAPPIDWCQMRRAIVAAARAEEARWTKPSGAKFVESEPSRLAILREYWSAVPGVNVNAAAAGSAADNANFAWSAAFICFVMQTAGVRAQHGFNFGPRHMNYIVGALRNRERSDRNRPFWLVDTVETQLEATPQPGDLICINRVCEGAMTHHSYHSLRARFWGNAPNDGANQNVAIDGCSHCALVVGTWDDPVNGGRFLETIGGNESNSVRIQHEIAVSPAGGIGDARAHNIFAMIKIMEC